MDTYSYDIAVAGGGASGLMFAANLSLGSRKGIILEKTQKPGTKLLMSGGGRCNITHGGSIKDFPAAYGKAGSKLRKCLYRHSNIELTSWLDAHGIPLADEKGDPLTAESLKAAGRIFPASMKASDVLDALTSQAELNGWEILTGSEVYDLKPPAQADSTWKIHSARRMISARSCVIATGGKTFPETGSDGGMFEIAGGLGIKVTEPRSALAPVYVRDYPYEELSGISVPDVTVTAFSADEENNKMTARMTGDLLFTHRGFSGPVILNISGYVCPGGLISIRYGRTSDDLPKRLQHALHDRSRGPSGDVRTKVLASLLDHDDFVVESVDENGMVTAGGISLDEIDTRTMQIGRMPGLYAIGEAVDADGITGGYNLQMCWSTACTAACAINSET